MHSTEQCGYEKRNNNIISEDFQVAAGYARPALGESDHGKSGASKAPFLCMESSVESKGLIGESESRSVPLQC